jgi:cytochrome c551/c552/cytochrome c2
LATARTFLICGLALLAAGCGHRSATADAGPSCVACHAAHYDWLGPCVQCHGGNPAATRTELAHDRLLRGDAAAWALPGSAATSRGQALRDSLGCRRCHLCGGRGERLAIDLDAVVWKRTQAELRSSLLDPASAMPRFGLDTGQADALIAVLLRDADPRRAAEKYQVRFTAGRTDSLRAFAKRCGPCHQALTREGPLGNGLSGPNLTALLGANYPTGRGPPWDRELLERWVRNPRAVRPAAIMPPPTVGAAELDAVVEALTPPPATR